MEIINDNNQFLETIKNTPEADYNLSFFHEHLRRVSTGDISNFWTAIEILATSPHYINRSILCASNVFSAKLKVNNRDFKYLMESLLSGFKGREPFINQLKSDLLKYENIPLKEIFEILSEDINKLDYFIICNEHIPKKAKVQMQNYDIILVDTTTMSSYFFTFTQNSERLLYEITHPLPYRLMYEEGEIILHLYSPAAQDEKYINFLEMKLFNKICSWSEPREIKVSPQNCRSLSLIDREDYGRLYQELKCKYGKAMCEIWPDNTDPSKFVFEDIAIATYLLLIWKQDNLHKNTDKKQTFVDLGCGNGLLVHILCSEGYKGYGLDLRKRDLWDKYPKSTILIEKPFIPTSDTFPEVDWLIGNHSDEITPWLPITATRSAKTCQYFVIPCCPFELNGKKYQRKISSNSVYDDFLYYVQDISMKCGFDTKFDKLRIPSTKRTCLVGWKISCSENSHENICNAMENFINEECNLISEYVVREKVEKIQNCTQINKNIQSDIVKRIVQLLLDKNKTIDGWNSGAKLSVKELADIIPKDLLQELKSECGGLQTLLKNQNIFEIRSGLVSLSKPKTVQEMKELYVVHKSNDNRMTLKRKKLLHNGNRTKLKKTENTDVDSFLQKKDCWYFNNHPQGCPLTAENCSFKH